MLKHIRSVNSSCFHWSCAPVRLIIRRLHSSHLVMCSSEPAVVQINQQGILTLCVKALSSVIFQFLLLYLASCVCFPLQFVWHVSNVPLSTQQNSLRLCCSCFHRNVISSLQPGQSVSLAMVARQYLCPFSLLRCSCGELRPERENVWEVWSKVQKKS